MPLLIGSTNWRIVLGHSFLRKINRLSKWKNSHSCQLDQLLLLAWWVKSHSLYLQILKI